jgi:DNA polymerase-1
MSGIENEVMKAFEEHDGKTKKRADKIPKPVTLESELERMSGLKWKDDLHIFEAVSVALRAGGLEFKGKKMKKDDVYEYYQILEYRRREKLKQEVRESKPDNYHIIQDQKSWAKMQRLLFCEEMVAWDTETTGLDYYEDRIVGISAYMPECDQAFYIPFRHTTGEKQLTPQQALAPIKQWLETEGNRSIWHNYKYDAHMLANDDIIPVSPYWCSQIVARLLNEHESAALKVQYDKYVAKTGKVVLFADIIDPGKMAETDILLSGVYACGDPHKTYELYKFQKPYIDNTGNLRNIWYNIESKLMEIDVRMERKGLRLNIEELHKIEAEQLPRIAQAETDMLESFKIDDEFLATMAEKTGKPAEEFNFSSNDHLAYLIYDVLEVGSEIPKALNKPVRSTAADVITTILESIPELEPMKLYRELSKLVSTYAHKLPEALEVDGRLHSQFDSLRTMTGRYASSEYGNKGKKKGTNFQNIPSRTDLGKSIRKCVIPDDNCMLISSDLSQIEPRVIAHLLYIWFGDSSMRDLYLANLDLYTTMAMKVFNLQYEQCVDKAKIYNEDGSYWEPRKLMKTGVLAGLYGQSVRGFALKMGVSEEVSQQFFDGLYSQFPGILPFREKILTLLRRNGYSETLGGRKRRFPDYQKNYAELRTLEKKFWNTMSATEKDRKKLLRRLCAKAEREAINGVVQGTAADTLKLNIIEMAALCARKGWDYLLSIHDELMMQLPIKDVTLENLGLINDVMTKTVEFSLPLKADLVIQPRWMEEYGLDEWDFDLQQPKEAA